MVSGPTRLPIDKRVFTVLFRRYRRPISRFVRQRIRDPQEVEDFVQETYLRMMHSGTLGAVKNCRAYLYEISRNLIIEKGKRHDRESEVLTFSSAEMEGRLEQESPSDSSDMDELELERDLSSGIDRLPPRQRDVMKLHREGRSDGEVAKRLGISVHSVRQDLMHARRALQEHLWPSGQGRSAK